MQESDRRSEDQWFREHEGGLLEQARVLRKKRAGERAECTFCEGTYVDAGELDQVVLEKGEDRKGFFRKLIGI